MNTNIYWDSSSWHDNFNNNVCRNNTREGPNDPYNMTFKNIIFNTSNN